MTLAVSVKIYAVTLVRKQVCFNRELVSLYRPTMNAKRSQRYRAGYADDDQCPVIKHRPHQNR